METPKSILADIAPFISFSEVSSSYLNKSRSWLGNKINETLINGVRYHLNREEVDNLADILENLSIRVSATAKHLKEYSSTLKRQTGVYYTEQNPFNHPLFLDWYSSISQPTIVVEPFAGSCNIPLLLKNIGIEPKWQCYDISPIRDTGYIIVKRDSIANMPKGRIIITNPPYLAKNSAKRRGLDYPDTAYQDVYLYCLEKMLTASKYVAAILPESFITSNLFQERLYGIVSLAGDYFMDTNCPVCLALFVPDRTKTFQIYRSEQYLGDYQSIIQTLSFKTSPYETVWKFNCPSGAIGVQCIDTTRDYIRFLSGEEIAKERILQSSRSYTRIDGLPLGVDRAKFLSLCNSILTDYRGSTHDILLTSFKGKRTDGHYRRRIDFGTIKSIMDTALSFC